MLIERAVATDYDAICAALEECDRMHVEHTPDVFCPRTGQARPMAWLLERIQAPDRAVLVAREDGAVVGVIEVSMKPPRDADGFVPRRVASIDDVAVRELHRGRGIGRALLEAAHEWALAKGAVAVQLHVWSWNDGARRLYERIGYATRGFVMEAPLRDRS